MAGAGDRAGFGRGVGAVAVAGRDPTLAERPARAWVPALGSGCGRPGVTGSRRGRGRWRSSRPRWPAWGGTNTDQRWVTGLANLGAGLDATASAGPRCATPSVLYFWGNLSPDGRGSALTVRSHCSRYCCADALATLLRSVAKADCMAGQALRDVHVEGRTHRLALLIRRRDRDRDDAGLAGLEVEHHVGPVDRRRDHGGVGTRRREGQVVA